MAQVMDVTNEIEGIALVGQSFEHDMQPYGVRRFIIEKVERHTYKLSYYPYNTVSKLRLYGRIYWGHETSYLFGHTSTRDIAGRMETVYGVEHRHLDKMEKVSIAM